MQPELPENQDNATIEKAPVILTLPQVLDTFDNLDLMRRTMVLTDAATALRVSEILALMWKDLDFVAQLIRASIACLHESALEIYVLPTSIAATKCKFRYLIKSSVSRSLYSFPCPKPNRDQEWPNQYC